MPIFAKILDMHFRKFLLILLCYGPYIVAFGQEIVSDSAVVQIAPITVNALGIESEYRTYGGNISIIKKADLGTADPTTIQESINRIPGVYMHAGAINTNRITIRGIGARSPFSTNKIRAYFGEIPLTNGSGETTVEDIDLASLSAYEVIKGPNSSIYGSGLGGVILMTPDRPTSDQFQITNDFTIGSFDLVKEQLSVSASTDKLKTFVSVGHLSSQGYRDNNEVNRSHALLNLEYMQGTNKLNLLTYYVDQKAFIPSSINESNFENDPTKAAFTWGNAEGFEDYFTLLQGVGFSSIISKMITFKSSVFMSHRENYEPRPFNILDEKTTGWGTRNRLIFDLNKQTTWMVGTELFWDQHSFRTLNNLYQDFPGMGSVEGDQLNALKERRYYVNVFSQIDHELTKGLILSGGVNFNNTQYKIEDQFVDAINQSGEYNYEGILSPRVSLNYQIIPNLNTYFSLSHGFSPPTLEETLLPDGAINPEIRPETGWNSEIGLRGTFEKAQFDLTFYRMQVENLLVSRRTAEDQFIGINAGVTRHQGVELSYQLTIVNNHMVRVSNQGSYSFSDFIFDDFIDGQNSFSGNQLTGVPKHLYFNRFHFTLNSFLYAYLDQQYTSEIPVTDDNTVYSDQYLLVNTTIGHRREVGNWLYDLGLTVRNITDQKYAAMLLINATGFGGAAPRYYYPGLPLNWFIRARITYTL